jgi:ubiquitin carboxyl-terminal hydrolase 36/42
MAITEQGTKFLTSFQNIEDIEPNLELELRIKLSSQHRDYTIPDYFADYLRDFFVRNKLPCTTERTTVERYADIRKITNTDTGEVRYERKQRVNIVDMPAIRFTPVYSFDIRISLARETPVDYTENVGKFDPSQTRKRTRYMYSVNRSDGVSIASYILTKIGEIQPFYEFEIEFNVYEGDVRRHIIESYHQMMKLLYLDIQRPFLTHKVVQDIYIGLGIKEAKPKNFKRYHAWDVLNVTNGYTVTNKLDGERMVVISIPGGPLQGIFAFNKRRILRLSLNQRKLDMVLDTEWYDDKFHVFDCMRQNGQTITQMKHSDRLSKAREIVDQLKEVECLSIIMKEFFPSREAISLLNRIEYTENDGLVFTPNEKYESDSIYKWKFPEKMTIDFQVRWFRSSYQLYVYTKGDRFIPFFIDRDVIATYHGKQLRDGGIYEFGYQDGQFVLFRERPDKDRPNFVTVAKDVWADIINPLTQNELSRLLSPIRILSNDMKRLLIDEHCGDKTILDLGVGRGGDLGKYTKIKVNHLYGVEPNPENLAECRKRLDNNPYMKPRTDLLNAMAQETVKIRDFLKNQQVDVVTSFLSLSFFFFSEGDLNSFIDTVVSSLKEGGVFIGTTIVGSKTRELLDSRNGLFEFEGGSIKWGEGRKRVIVSMKDTIVGENQEESLVDFELLTERLKEHRIMLIKREEFVWDREHLTESENIFNSLYETFVFKKYTATEPSSLPLSLPSPLPSFPSLPKVLDDQPEPIPKGMTFIEEILRRVMMPKYKDCLPLLTRQIKASSLPDVVFQFGKKEYSFQGGLFDSIDTSLFERMAHIRIPNISRVYGYIPYDGKTLVLNELYKTKTVPILNFMKKHKTSTRNNKQDILYSLMFQLHFTFMLLTKLNIEVTDKTQIVVRRDQSVSNITYAFGTTVHVIDGIVITLTDFLNNGTVIDKSVLFQTIFGSDLTNIPQPYKEKILEKEDIEYVASPISDLFQFQQRRKRGIANAGNTCWLNSVVQAIASLPPIMNYFCNKTTNFRNDLVAGDTDITQSFAELVCRLTLSRTTTPINKPTIRNGFLRLLCMKYPEYSGFDQHDASEFFTHLTDLLDTQLRKTNIIQRLFSGEFVSHKTCEECHTNISNRESFMSLALPVTSGQIEQCIENFLSTETIPDAICEKCKKRTTQKKTYEITQLPSVMVMTLKRFEYNRQTGKISKIDRDVTFPNRLDFGQQTYKLCSFVNHKGKSFDGGHYYTYSETGENEWTEFNDSDCSTISNFSGRNAYILFYHKV